MNSLYENIAESLWSSCLEEDIGSAEWYISCLNEKALFGSMISLKLELNNIGEKNG